VTRHLYDGRADWCVLCGHTATQPVPLTDGCTACTRCATNPSMADLLRHHNDGPVVARGLDALQATAGLPSTDWPGCIE
jgi:hypothetical protein